MRTIVARGGHFSGNNKKDLENSEIKDINLVLIYPNGETKNILTSEKLFRTFIETDTTIIYE